MNIIKSVTGLIAAAMAVATVSHGAMADDYPSKPVEMEHHLP